MIESQLAPPRNVLRVAIVGGGVTGLTTAYDLTNSRLGGHFAVTVLEGADNLGGLAAGFKGRPEWDWPLEHYYHHLFLSDRAMLELLKELQFDHALKHYRPNTAIHHQGQNYPLDSVTRVLRFPLIPLLDRVRMGMAIGYLRYYPGQPWRKFDKQLADGWLRKWMGPRAYEAAWEFQLQGKFGDYYKQINLAWFWARVKARTTKLAYFDGGFQAFIDRLATQARYQGVEIRLNARVRSIRPGAKQGFEVDVVGQTPEEYDIVLSTTSPSLMEQLTPDLPTTYLGQLSKLRSMGAVVLTVALDRKLTEDMYWISLPKREGIPFLALVEHTNMIDPSRYDGDHLLYLGDYLPPEHRYFNMSVDELVAEFTPHLSKFNPDFERSWVTGAWVHRARYAQPVPPVGYLELIPDIRTPLSRLYFASMSQVYPWDRGTNFAVEMGRQVAGMIVADAATQPFSRREPIHGSVDNR